MMRKERRISRRHDNMSFTPEERVTYWRERIIEKFVSMMKQTQIDFQRIRDDIAHVGFEDAKIKEALKGIDVAYAKLAQEITKAKLKKESHEHKTDKKADSVAPVAG